MTFIRTLASIGLAALAAMSISAAQANVISGSIWAVPDATAGNAAPASIPAAPADITFSVNTPMDFSGDGVSRSTWLASSAAFNIVENTAGALAALMSDGVTGTLLEFTGLVTVHNGDHFTVTHDDGLTLTIGGITVISEPGPTSPVLTDETYTGPDGTFAFQLVYGECCSGPAVLQIDLPFTNVPEPASIAILGVALLGLGAVRRRLAA